MRDGELRAMQCGEPAHVFASRDGVAWRAVSPRPDDEVEDVEDEGPIVVEGMSLELSDGVLRSTRAGAASEVIAGAWPRDILPVAASAVDARASVVVFGNGTVLRRP
jgi:hypothetical protein